MKYCNHEKIWHSDFKIIIFWEFLNSFMLFLKWYMNVCVCVCVWEWTQYHLNGTFKWAQIWRSRTSGRGSVDAAISTWDIKTPDVLVASRSDTCCLDVRRLDASHSDMGCLDASHFNTSHLDACCLDASHFDMGCLDVRHLDAIHLDARRLDASRLDARRLDTTHMDAGRLDVGRLNARCLNAAIWNRDVWRNSLDACRFDLRRETFGTGCLNARC